MIRRLLVLLCVATLFLAALSCSEPGAPDITLPADPQITVTAAADSSVLVQWTADPASSSLAEIEVDSGTGGWHALARVTAGSTFRYGPVEPGRAYLYRIRLCNDVGCSGWVQATLIIPPPARPAEVVSMTAEATSATNAAIRVRVARGSSTGSVTLEYGVAENLSGAMTTAAQSLQIGVDTVLLTFTLDALASGSTYYFRVNVVDGLGTRRSPTSSFILPLLLPNTPAGLSVALISVTQARLTWNVPIAAGSEVRVEVRAGTGVFTELARLAASTSSFDHAALAESTEYTYRIRACNAAGCSAYSAEVSLTTAAGIPSTPTNLEAAATGSDRITLTWSDQSANETQFRVEMRTTGGFAEVTQLPANSTRFDHIGLALLTTYTYRIRACNAAGCSAYTAEAAATTSANLPSAVTNAASGITTTAATLHGSIRTGGAETTYWFEWGTTSTLSGATETTRTTVAATTPDNTQVNAALTGLAPGTTYYFRMRVQSSVGSSTGAILSLTTAPVAPPVPQAPTATTSAATDVTLTGATLNGALRTGGAETTYWFEWSTSPTLATLTETSRITVNANTADDTPVGANLTGLTEGATYYFRLRAQNAAGTASGTILNFTTTTRPQGAPSATTTAATNVTRTSALLNGLIRTGTLQTTYWFEWGTSPTLAGAQEIGRSSTPVNPPDSVAPISADLTGLTPGGTYYFRVLAQNSLGTSTGGVLSFSTSAATTPLIEVSGDLYDLYSNQAQLRALINPRGSETSAWFEWGTDPQLTGASVSPRRSIGAGSTSVNIFEMISPLALGTTYYFRVFAENAAGVVQGSISSFTVKKPDAPTVAINVDSVLFAVTVTPNFSGIGFVSETRSTCSVSPSTNAGCVGVPGGTGADVSLARTITFEFGACNRIGCSFASASANLPALGPVSNVTVTAPRPGEVLTSWELDNPIATFLVLRFEPSTDTELIVGNVPAGTRSFTDTTAQSGHTYRYRMIPVLPGTPTGSARRGAASQGVQITVP